MSQKKRKAEPSPKEPHPTRAKKTPLYIKGLALGRCGEGFSPPSPLGSETQSSVCQFWASVLGLAASGPADRACFLSCLPVRQRRGLWGWQK